MAVWAVEFYTTATGRCPVREYVDALDGAETAAMRKGLRLLGDLGLRRRLPHVRPLEQKVWELRIRTRRQHRVLYFAASGQRLVRLHAFTKRTQQTPRGEIETA